MTAVRSIGSRWLSTEVALVIFLLAAGAWVMALSVPSGAETWRFDLWVGAGALSVIGACMLIAAVALRSNLGVAGARSALSAADIRPDDVPNVAHLPVPAYSQVLGAGSVAEVNPEMELLLGYSRLDWLSDPDIWSRVIQREDSERVFAERDHHQRPGDRFHTEYRLRTRRGRSIWVREESVIAAAQEGDAHIRHGVLVDVNEWKRVEAALEHQALHDGLTDLPNRTLLQDRLQQAIVTSRREGKPVALLLMDLDRFKEVNDTFGHHYGDLLLRQVVTHLRYVLRESDTIARLGGDEFAVILPGDDERGAALTAEKILHVLRQPYSAEEHTLDIGASIGVALFPEHGHDAQSLLQRADVAMYAAKQRNAGYALYEPHRDPYTPSRLTLVRELRDAIEHDHLVLHYQPKAQLAAGDSQHVEALVRWFHPEQGPIAPEEVVALAEHAGMMKPLTTWVLNAALRQCHLWQEAGTEVSVAVNISARSLHDPSLVDTIGALLRRWNVAPTSLEIEITEGALMLDPHGSMKTLERLHRMGVCISIDDFGTGYSSLSYLTRVPADQIKIDKSFVLGMTRDDRSAFIVRSVIDIGHNLSLRVVAEGVENQETWDLLAEMGCDVAQGYHLSRPLPASEVGPWLTLYGRRAS